MASSKCRWFINAAELDGLIERTIKFISPLVPLAPTMETNMRILKNTQKKLRPYFGDTEMQNAASSSFGSTF